MNILYKTCNSCSFQREKKHKWTLSPWQTLQKLQNLCSNICGSLPYKLDQFCTFKKLQSLGALMAACIWILKFISLHWSWRKLTILHFLVEVKRDFWICILKYRLYTHSLSFVTFESCRADPCCSPRADKHDKSATEIHNLKRNSKAMTSSSLPGFYDKTLSSYVDR